jgi:uncharacterized protein (TIGR02246 family)
MRAVAAAGLVLMALAAGPQAFGFAEDGIRSVEMGQAENWNRHDAAGYAALFTPDADVVNVLGWHWKGRRELAARLGRAFAGVFRNSRLTIDSVETRLLRPDVAIAHVRWSMTGAMSPDGRSQDIPQHGIQTQVLSRARGHWHIDAFQNTNSVPERPFPMRDVKQR